MNILAFDTCFGAVSAVVSRHAPGAAHEVEADILSEAFVPLSIGHAERLLPMIDAAMAEAGLTFGQLNRIAVTVGPGGFTGLRVGVSAARALALATGLPVVGMSSLALMSVGAARLIGKTSSPRTLVVAVDARRDAFYVQTFSADAVQVQSQPALMSAAEAVAALPSTPLMIVGSGARAIADAAGRDDILTELPDLQPNARDLAYLAHRLPPLDRVTPLYLRAADAKPSAVPPLSRRPGP